MSELNELQRLPLPNFEICSELELYARCRGAAEYAYNKSELRIQAGGRVSFATFYGGFSIGKWRKLAGISRLRLRLDLLGAGQVEVWNWRAGHPSRLLVVAETASPGPVAIEVPVDEAVDGIIAPEFVAWEPTTFRGGAWLTSDAPRRAVKLGIVLTSFQREAAAKATVRRLTSGLLSDPGVDASIVVIDNGRSLTPNDVAGATLIPNPNLGGSGGFARGLAHFQDLGGFTHVSFMDDDASAELESLRRAIQLLRYAYDEATAIVSGLIFQERPGTQLEVGGQMPGDMWGPVRQGVDLRRLRSLVKNEMPLRIDYGGWWMFFFPIAYVRNLPFPFFLRGDDVEFPQANDFKLVTLNGIASYGPDFLRKESPLNVALDRRGMLANVLLHKTPQTAVIAVLRGLTMGVSLANRYCYDHVDALAEGLRDVLSGPAAFEDISGFADGRRREIALRVRQPRASLEEVGVQYPRLKRRKRSVLWHAMSLLLCNGHLLPSFLLVRGPGILAPVWRSSSAQVFLRRKVFIQEGLEEQVIVAERDVRRYFASLGKVTGLSVRLLFALPRLRREFRAARAWFGSRAYWDRQFRAGMGTPALPHQSSAIKELAVGQRR